MTKEQLAAIERDFEDEVAVNSGETARIKIVDARALISEVRRLQEELEQPTAGSWALK
jgi:hypothetical protein